MSTAHEVEITICSGKNLKNVNWRNGQLKPYVVLWIGGYEHGAKPVGGEKCSTAVATKSEDDDDPIWEEKLLIPLANERLEDLALYLDVVHASSSDDKKPPKPLIGSARLALRDVVDSGGIGTTATRKIELVRPSGRPQGQLKLRINIIRHSYYFPPSSYDGCAVPPPPPNPYAYPYTTPPPGDAYQYSYRAPPPPSYGAPPPPDRYADYGAASYKKKSSKMGMGTGLAVGAAAGLLGGLALAEGIDYVEDKIEDDVAERVEDDLGYGDDF